MKAARAGAQKLMDAAFWRRHLLSIRKNGRFSNFDEQKIIEKYIDKLQIASHSNIAVDIGAGDGVRKSNTFKLFASGWKGVGIDGDRTKAAKMAGIYKYLPNVFACCCLVSPSNVTHLLKAYSIESNFGVLSLDIDGNDYWVLDAILNSYRPKLIVSEYNEKIPPPIKFTVNYRPDFQVRHHFFGYSISKLEELLVKHRYVVLEIEYNNVFLAPAETKGVTAVSIEQAYRDGYADRPDRIQKFPQNNNMENLLHLNAIEGIEFLDTFYASHKGEYEIGS